MPFSHNLREGIEEGFDSFGLNRFGGLPGGGPDTTCEARGHFFGDSLSAIWCGSCCFGIRFGFGLCRFAFGAFACTFRFDLGMTTCSSCSASSSSSSDLSSLKVLRSGMLCFFHLSSGNSFVISNDPFFPRTLSPNNENLFCCHLAKQVCFLPSRHILR